MRGAVLTAVIGLALGAVALHTRWAPANGIAAADSPSGQRAQLVASQRRAAQGPIVGTAARFDVSPPLRSIPPVAATSRGDEDEPAASGPVGRTRHEADPALQRTAGSGVFGPNIPSTGINFAGIANPCGCNPPDPNGAVGPDHFVEMVNFDFEIFSRTGTSLYGPAATITLWSGFGGPCETETAGDPVVLHDQLADRWLLSHFTDGVAPFFFCTAISQSSDPTGSYYRYAFQTPNWPDYPKYGVWPDAYYVNTRESVGGVLANLALERDRMLVGDPAPRVVRFTTPETATGPNGLLPSDLDGTTLPPPGSPAFFVGTQDDDFGAASDALLLYRFHVDWTDTAASTFGGPTVLPTAPFDSVFPCAPGARDCIPQPGTTRKLDALSYRQRPTFRLAYRNFGTHESLVTNQSVEGAAGIAGIRWWELRNPGSAPTIYQEGTYAPGATDGIHRWMGSVAMDRFGDVGLGYSVSNGVDVYPGIRYSGRLAADPLGTLPQGEGSIVEGSGSQTGASRWGDYTSMAVDPVDDCTFWYTNEYYASTSPIGWSTRIGSFKFPSCNVPTAVKVLGLDARWADGTVRVSWRTASESDALGYNLYRSAGAGPFRRLNRSLIAARHTGDTGRYRLVDPGVTRGKGYTYRLQIIDQSGKRSWYPVRSAAS
jgi:hypothetical protein